MDTQHDRSRQTHGDSRTGKTETRDQLNDPRTHDGRFAREHHAADDTVHAALEGLQREGAENADALEKQAELDRRKRHAGESDEDHRARLADDERRRREAGGLPRETAEQRKAREMEWGITTNAPVIEQLPFDAGSEQLRADDMDREL